MNCGSIHIIGNAPRIATTIFFVCFVLVFYNDSSSFSCRICSSSSACNLLDNAPDLSGNELCGVCIGVGNGVDGYFGGDEAGVLNIVAVVIVSRNVSNCFKESALCKVSRGRIGGTPPNPSKT